MFDPQAFLNTAYSEPSSTRSIPIPEGEYVATISKFSPREVQRKDGTKQVVMDIYWEIDDRDGSVKAVTGMDKNSARQSLFLETTSNGNLDMSEGKNVQLGRLREAVHQNGAGQPWSFSMLMGKVARVLLVHKSGDNGETFANITKVTEI